jgi:hypothetical protein
MSWYFISLLSDRRVRQRQGAEVEPLAGAAVSPCHNRLDGCHKTPTECEFDECATKRPVHCVGHFVAWGRATHG